MKFARAISISAISIDCSTPPLLASRICWWNAVLAFHQQIREASSGGVEQSMLIAELEIARANFISTYRSVISRGDLSTIPVWDFPLGSTRYIHNHGPDEGHGIYCPETRGADGLLRGACLQEEK